MDMNPAKTIIDYLGGAKLTAMIVGKHPSRVYRWAYPLDKREGCGGIIPLRDQQRILEYCVENSIDLTRDDFFSCNRIAKLLAETNANTPEVLPSGVKAEARCMDDASRAPVAFKGEGFR